jgi:hypothetical protein
MKQQVECKNPQEVASAFPLTSLLAGWYFRVREVSAGQFIAEGIDLWGRKVSHQGGDSQVALNQCVSSARSVVAQAGRAGAA